MWVIDPTRTYSKYFSAKALSKQENVKWQDTKQYVPTQANSLTNASVAFSIQGDGLSDVTHNYGFMKATWYVTFRGQSTA